MHLSFPYDSTQKQKFDNSKTAKAEKPPTFGSASGCVILTSKHPARTAYQHLPVSPCLKTESFNQRHVSAFPQTKAAPHFPHSEAALAGEEISSGATLARLSRTCELRGSANSFKFSAE